jgi:hypothetical protein
MRKSGLGLFCSISYSQIQLATCCPVQAIANTSINHTIQLWSMQSSNQPGLTETFMCTKTSTKELEIK